MMAAVSQPMQTPLAALQVTASVGVTLFPIDDRDADTLLRHADHAMYQAKEQGKNQVQVFDVQHARSQQAHREQLLRLRRALASQEFVLHYQPKVDLQDGHIVGVEALLRWQHPELGMQPPLSFLPFIENTELEQPVGEWVIGSVLAQMAAWQAQGLRLVASANISPHHLLRPEFGDRLRALLAAHPGASPELLELEILESATVTDLGRAAQTVKDCHQLGVKVSLDDFGTGHSALALLRHLPVDGLKIDQSFVRDMLRDGNDHALVNAVIRLGEAFGRDVTAEGVETMDDAAELRALGCRYGQGYGFARPMPAAQILPWIAVWTASASWPPAG
jgi:EAL domain-containing protein (putative c-di-GMP-specific phosphodiesterase class I)